MRKFAVVSVSMLVAALVAQGCKQKSSSKESASTPVVSNSQPAADLEAERKRLENERIALENERKNLEAERAKLNQQTTTPPVPNIPNTSTPVTSIHSCAKTSSFLSNQITCDEYYNLTAQEVTNLQSQCGGNLLPNFPIPLPMGGQGTFAQKACDATLNGAARVGGCRSQDNRRTFWYYGQVNVAQIQAQCQSQGMTFVNP